MDDLIAVGDSFDIQFVWQLPDGDYLRAVFSAEVLDIIEAAQKYFVRLTAFRAGRQESADGKHTRSRDERSTEYWPLVLDLVDRRVTLAWETADGRPLHMRLMTLTGEHDFFRRYNMTEEEMNQLALEKLAIRFEKLQGTAANDPVTD
ncbi:MAG: hypothetical protein M9928_09660 [Anaerolineae bacterium]|nr:hypothetical protein [Anaerolineae bacterium]MCO5190103.1 hypothetical protein [Anaerolineae bacterium]MCO5197791.1 hypothetical protein [Anaerolineae bacterium]MCO5205287.1 hypothetical protein [Anaerolineae bacterium]